VPVVVLLAPASGARVVVVSPHSDDGVLSLGASMSRWARAGARVELLTVFALDPQSSAETGGWDRRGGFSTEGEAARARRAEDASACAILGARPVWLPFGSLDYERHGDEDAVSRAVGDVADGAQLVLLPGSPLTHPDHAWLTTLVSRSLEPARVAYYAEQPYTKRAGRAVFEVERVPARDRLAKWRAIRCYRSQLPLLGLSGRLRAGPLALAFAEERLARGCAL
jgi:LmbE family N-acetylglucosaminyl deacetylase